MTRTEYGDGAARSCITRRAVGQDFDFSVGDDVEGIAGITGPEQDFTRLQAAFANSRQYLFDPLGRQVAYQVARRQQLDALTRIRLFARQRIFTELGNATYSRSFAFQKQRCRVVDDGACSEPRTDECPCRVRIEALMMKGLRAFIRKLDRQRRDQGAGGKS